jgi:hypothetical protein
VTELNELFLVGPPLPSELQVGRGPFVVGMVERLVAAEKLKLLATRRTGKTSAARAALDDLRAAKLLAADVDLARTPGEENVAAVLADQLAPGLVEASRANRATTWLVAAPDGEDALDWVTGRLLAGRMSAGTVLERAAEGCAPGAGGVLLDEAHHVADWHPADQTSLREFLRHDLKLGVIIASSEASALAKLTGEQQPFEFVGMTLPLPRISDEDWRAALRPRFEAFDAAVTDGALDLLLEESMLHPYCTMLLARESARIGRPLGETGEPAVLAALEVAEKDEAWGLRGGG